MRTGFKISIGKLDARKLKTIAIATVAAAVPLAGIFMPKAIVPLLIAASFIGALELAGADRFRVSLSVIAITAALITWSGISAFWAIEIGSAIQGAIQLAGGAIIGFIFILAAQGCDSDARRQIGWTLIVGWSLAVLVIGIEVAFEGPIFRFLLRLDYREFGTTVGPFWLSNGVSVIVLLSWPVSAALWQFGRALAALPIVLAATVSLAVRVEAGLVALAIGLAVAGLIATLRRRAAVSLSVIVVLLALAVPPSLHWLGDPASAAARYSSLSGAAQHRIAIWAFTAERIAEHPWLGWGMNASKFIPGGKTMLVEPTGRNLGDALPLHPHNAVLQMWLELGIVGAGLYIALIVALIELAMRGPGASWMMGQLFAAFTIANLSYGQWQAWWLAVLWISAGMAVVMLRSGGSAAELGYQIPAEVPLKERIQGPTKPG